MRPLSLPHLFSPARIGSLELRNRLVMSPMETGYGTREGLPSESQITYFEARARGGVGLITTGASTVDLRHREVPNGLHFSSDAVIEAHRVLTDRVHACGAKVQPQLVHPGPDGLGPVLSGAESVGPSVIPSILTGAPCRELALDEIPGIVELFAAAARRARAAGYDGVELHAAHGYMLLGSFLTPWRNRRTDGYTGATQEGRVRLVGEVVRAIKAASGEDFPLTLRISGFERVPGGRSLEDTQQIAPNLAALGVDAFHVSGGVIDRLTTQMVAGASYPEAHNLAAAEALKRVVDVPVMTVGRIHDPRLADRIVREGRADFVAMGRPLLADPELPNKARTGRLGEIRRCISCQSCIDSMETGRMGCAVNAFTGRESQWGVVPARRPKRVVVIGGGSAGLEAARVAAGRGHVVSLYEKGPRLGGALVAASIVRPENQLLLDFLMTEVESAGVDVVLGRALEADEVLRLGADAVVVATGGRRETPAIEGADLPHVATGSQVVELLSAGPLRPTGNGSSNSDSSHTVGTGLPWGRSIAIVGADLVAIELAEFLAARERRVAVFESGPAIAPEIGAKLRSEHLEQLDLAGVPVNVGVEIERITSGGLQLSRAGAAAWIAAETVILAGELRADTALYDGISGHVPEVHAIGDCTGSGLIAKAMREAAEVAIRL